MTRTAGGFDLFKAFWIITLTLGVALLVLGIVGPLLSFNSSVFKAGPAASVTFNATFPYWTDTFSLPPVHAGTVVELVATKTGPGNVTIQIVGLYAPSGSVPEYYTVRLDNFVQSVDTNLTLHNAGQYVFLVTSYDARYNISVNGVFQSLYDFVLGIYWGSALVLAGLISFYYYRIVRRREAMVEREMKEGGQRDDSKIPYL